MPRNELAEFVETRGCRPSDAWSGGRSAIRPGRSWFARRGDVASGPVVDCRAGGM